MEDDPGYKPRRARGTPTFRFSLKVGAAVGVGCFALHFLQWYFIKDRIYRKVAAGYYDVSENMKKRRKVMDTMSAVPHTRENRNAKFEDYSRITDFDASNALDADLK